MGEMTWPERLRVDFGSLCFRLFLWACKLTEEQYFEQVAMPTHRIAYMKMQATEPLRDALKLIASGHWQTDSEAQHIARAALTRGEVGR